MGKLSNAKKTVSQAAEIIMTDSTSDKIAATLIKRTALDASDKPVIRTALDASDLRANDHAFADWQDYSLESMVLTWAQHLHPLRHLWKVIRWHPTPISRLSSPTCCPV